MWPQFICPNCRAVADLEADVDDPFPDAEWEEIGVDDVAEEHGALTQVTNMSSGQQVPAIERSNSTGDIASNHVHAGSQENTGEDSTGSGSELHQAMGHLNIESHNNSATGSSESHSSIGPVNIRSDRSAARQEIGSNTRAASFDVESSMCINRTPSPNDRLPPGTGDMSGPDGLMTPRNDTGPFICT